MLPLIVPCAVRIHEIGFQYSGSGKGPGQAGNQSAALVVSDHELARGVAIVGCLALHRGKIAVRKFLAAGKEGREGVLCVRIIRLLQPPTEVRVLRVLTPRRGVGSRSELPGCRNVSDE